MIKFLSFVGLTFVSSVVFGCVHPESSERPSSTSEFNTALEACTTYVGDDPIFKALNQLFGAAKSCSREQDREGDVDFGEIISVTWDGADFIRETRPPESAIIEVNFAPSALVSRDWFNLNRGKLVPAELGIDWTNDIAPEPNIEHYVSSEQGFNGIVKIVSSMEGKLMSFRLSYAL